LQSVKTSSMTVRTGLRPLTVVVAAVAVVVTAALAWTASTVNRDSNNGLLQLQVRQAAAALSAAVPSVHTQLADALQLAAATKPSTFKHFISEVGAEKDFISISLWQRSSTGAHLLALVGTTPRLVLDGKASTFLSHLRPNAQLQVLGFLTGSSPRLGYAELPPGDSHLVVYAESMLPPTRKVAVPRSSAFDDLNFALYLGRTVRSSELVEASVATPIQGPQASVTVPFGDTRITLVGSTTTQLAGGLSAALPWTVLAVGIALSLATASTVEYVARRRELAEQLAAVNEELYVQQRTIAGTLQQALLPELPALPAVELAARYLPGVDGVEVGGDWYDVICTEENGCVFVVGDVSGRGLQAAKTMASLRYATRAYIAQGDGPEAVLSKLDQLLSFDTEHQFATVLIGVIEHSGDRLMLASAGHFPPLMVSDIGAEFLEVPIGTPVGIKLAGRPPAMSIPLPKRVTLLAFTDGLIERRDEHLDISMKRLQLAAEPNVGSVAEMLDHILATLIPTGGDDDVVILGLRWRS
jgi:serine phosphatase RsbU (regulator of sigma subunit)